jgi:hypothetical protein
MKIYDDRVVFEREDFTSGELGLLKLAFSLLEEVGSVFEYGDVWDDREKVCNIIFNLKNKLGIYDLLD